jgi:hypothetical protein
MVRTIQGTAFAVLVLATRTAGCTTTGYTGGRSGGWENFRAATPQAWRDA